MSVAGALFMINNLQVHWQDGMLLTAKHFELLQNYLQQLSCSQLKIVNPYYWGISKFKIKTEELRNGKLCIDEIRGIFPDGSPFDITQNNTPQLELKFTSKVENQAIFIYFKPEEYTDKDEEFCTRSLKISLTTENCPYFNCIKIAIIKNITDHDGIILDQHYIPPLLNLNSSPALISKLNLLYHCLKNYANDQYDVSNIARLIANPFEHPYQCYIYLYNLSHQLQIAMNSYQHDNQQYLVTTIDTLVNKISNNKNAYISKKFNRDGYYWHAQLEASINQNTELLLGIPLLTNHQLLPINLIRVSASSQLKNIVQHALEGIKLIEYKKLHYFNTQTHHIFKVDTHSSYWQDVIYEKKLSVYIPSTHINSEPKLWMKL